MVILTVLHYWHMYMTSSGECSTSLGSLSEEAHQLTRISTKFCTQGLHKELGYGLLQSPELLQFAHTGQ